jgi:hypothetical protein
MERKSLLNNKDSDIWIMNKRIYIIPRTEVLTLELEAQLLVGSDIKDGTEIGGELEEGEEFDVKERGDSWEYDW